MISQLKNKLNKSVSIAPLAMFRVIFGGVMFAAVIRFMLKGWVYDLYVKPDFYFTYYGFEWVKPLGETAMYVVFTIMALSFLFVMLGWFYRAASVSAFSTFTYVELLDKSNYLNHYYFVSIICFLLLFVPAHRYFSIDVFRKPHLKIMQVPAWMVNIFKLQLAIVYIYAGIAKLNYDWLIRAMPLKIWLPANGHLPIIGPLLEQEWTAYLFSWFGAVYDLTIVFFLMNRKTRNWAYFFVIVFHVFTKILFPIGMFPYVMMLSTLIFFSEAFHQRMIDLITKGLLNIMSPLRGFAPIFISRFYNRISLSGLAIIPKGWKDYRVNAKRININPEGVTFFRRLSATILILHFTIQILFPLRFVLYPGNLFWTESGYRFSWRVMLMEKAGTAFFYVKDAETGKESEISNCDYLTANQEKMMATQPDMILQYAHFLEKKYSEKGMKNPQVRVESYVTLNGSGSRLYTDNRVDLTKEKESFTSCKWILPFKEN